MGAVDELLKINDTRVRKWGTKLLALADYDQPVPEAFFNVDSEPVLPSNYIQLGFVTTDGVTQAKSISAEATRMDQQLEPVRNDVTGIDQSLTVTFGESSSAWVNAVAHGKRVADFPADPHTPWVYHDGEISDFPYYRLLLLAQDGVGSNTFYRVEYAYRAQVTAMTDRTLSRASAEGFGFTFGLFKDPAVGRSLTRAENGPGFTLPLASSATAGTPGSFLPLGSRIPGTLSELQGGAITANPATAWTTGQYVNLGDASKAYWSGTAWVTGTAS